MSASAESFVSWVDFSAAEQERARLAIALFKENDTRDELGLGSIRDALADVLFPGTSTIQTRLRYFLFVPWIYRELEDSGRTNSGNVASRLRTRELDLIPILKGAADNEGTFGKTSGNALQRLPSSVYWFGLSKWGMFRPDQTQEEYHRSWAALRARRSHERPADDSGVSMGRVDTWHKGFPLPPENFPEGLTFDLTHEEATFFRERILDSCRGSLLAHAVNHRAENLDADFPWRAFDKLPTELRQWVTLAERFSLLMHGAAWVYNLALAEQSSFPHHKEKGKEHLEHLTAWEQHAKTEGIGTWNLQELWDALAQRTKSPAPPTREFVEKWQTLVRDVGNGSLASSEAAVTLMRGRERRLKGTRSRFTNARALENWGGASGTARINYRWFRSRGLLVDLYAGLDRKGG